MNQSHITGAVNELKVAEYFTSKGWGVFMPLMTQSASDMLVDNGTETRRIQVKSAHVMESGNYNNIQCRIQAGGKYRKYIAEDTWLAIVHGDMMWIIPPNEIPKKKSLYLLNAKAKTGKDKGYDPDKWRVR